ncbi:MAG: preprotein translocase subunit YajC [Pseudomonadota bacterium]
MIITPAWAQSAGGGGGIFADTLLIPMILIFAIMYFLIIRPQQQRVKAHREMVANVRRGDGVVTAGGLIGKVTKVFDDDEIQIEIADGVRVRAMKQTLSDVRPKGGPAPDKEGGKSKAADKSDAKNDTKAGAKTGAKAAKAGS